MLLNKNCICYSGDKKDCPVSQKGKTYRIVNSSGSLLTVYEVDTCLIPGVQHKKCDYLILVENHHEKKAFLIELKGTDLTSAIHQIENSLQILGNSIRGYQIFGRIVGRRITPNIRSRRSALEEKLRQLGGDLKIISGYEYAETV